MAQARYKEIRASLANIIKAKFAPIRNNDTTLEIIP